MEGSSNEETIHYRVLHNIYGLPPLQSVVLNFFFFIFFFGGGGGGGGCWLSEPILGSSINFLVLINCHRKCNSESMVGCHGILIRVSGTVKSHERVTVKSQIEPFPYLLCGPFQKVDFVINSPTTLTSTL